LVKLELEPGGAKRRQSWCLLIPADRGQRWLAAGPPISLRASISGFTAFISHYFERGVLPLLLG